MDPTHQGRSYWGGLVAGMSISSAGFATVGACGEVTGVSVSVLLGVPPVLLGAPEFGAPEGDPDDPVAPLADVPDVAAAPLACAPDVPEVSFDCVPDVAAASVLAGAAAAGAAGAAGAARLSTLLVAVPPQPSGTATAVARTVAGEMLPALSSVRTR